MKNAMALVALAIAGTTLMSFGLESKSLQNDQWFEFTPGAATPNPLNPDQYTPIGNTPPSDCLSGATICAVRSDSEELTEEHLSELNSSGEMSGPSNNANVVFKQ